MASSPEALAICADRAAEILDDMAPVRERDIIPLLQKLQDAYGYLPREVMLEVAQRTGLPASRLYGVATFYAQFHLKPRGRHTIRCCRGTACHVRGSKEIAETIKRTLAVEEGDTTADGRFTFEVVACLGTCFLAPVIMINDDYYGSLKQGQLAQILSNYP
jgi:NADH-quinone oxidoreductase subunit E